ncbi:run domain Beclin-1-interacting and cysteine-rich domain-containing protein [Atheta coriaria]|uniref:run domain Beclin-1-interacting and cysteine-rich domain-containing protein n=1 Tax=Dalotia coriaria TaxID=877792 RepID=UPI0031F40C5D
MSLQEDNSAKHQQLLRDLKTTVEGLLNSQATYLWNIYGGLNRLHVDLEKIFKHGCRGTDVNSWDYWPFIQGLEWLQPDVMNTSFSIESECKNNLPSHVKNDRASIWLYRNIENHSLSQKLCWLLSDKNHVQQCYREHAFLCSTEYAEATLYCLKAVELNQPSLISEIKPKLFVAKNSNYHRVHRRCSSFPDSHLKRKLSNRAMFDALEENKEKEKSNVTRIVSKLRSWNSMPNLVNNCPKIRNRSYTTNTSPSTPLNMNKQKQLKPVKSVNSKHILIDCNIIEHTPPESTSHNYLQASASCSKPHSLGSSGPEFSLLGTIAGISGEKDIRNLPKKTFIEDGGLSVMPMATGYFPKPTKGQSLTSFLISSEQSRGNAELDRENAHFSICEAVIAAFEQIKSSKELKLSEEQQEESDEEINHLKQRIRLRRRQKIEEKQRRLWANSLSDAKTDTTTEVSPASISSSGTFSASISSSDDDDYFQVDETSNLQDNTGLSMSMASLYSDADIMKRPRGVPDGASDALSAEGVALSLISKFSDKQLPRASDLEWLISEEEVPQALLPLPKSWPVNPDESENEFSTPLRGTTEWAPPRPQIIFTMHPMPCRKTIMEKQNYRCAGCGTRVATKYAAKFRYCNYLGRYFCTGCHTNQVAIIPARVIHQWNFTRCSVSSFSYRLIEQMHTDPLFRVFQLNPKIGKLSRNMEVCKKYRLGLMYLKDYILTCRLAENIQDLIRSEESYLSSDPDIYSLEDLIMIRTGELKNKLKYIVEVCCRHTSECELCLARGFICEICKSAEVLFPWQMKIVSRCAQCGSCFHSKCWNKVDAPCARCCRRLSN